MKYDLEELIKKDMTIEENTPKELSELVRKMMKEGVPVEKEARNKKAKVVKAATVILAAVLATGGVAYAATCIWNPKVAEIIGIDGNQKVMREMEQQGFVDGPLSTSMDNGQVYSATDKDITVEVLQTIADGDYTQVYLQASFGEKYTILEDKINKVTGNKLPKIRIGDSKVTCSDGKEFSAAGNVEEVVDEHTVILHYEFAHNFSDCGVELSIYSFVCNSLDKNVSNTVAKGNWTLKWNPSQGTTKGVYRLNRDIDINGYTITLDRLEVTPVSYTLYIKDTKDWRTLFHMEGAVKRLKGEKLNRDKNGNLIFDYLIKDTEASEKENKLSKEGYDFYAFDNMLAWAGDEQIRQGSENVEMCAPEGNDCAEIKGTWDNAAGYKKLTKICFGGQYINMDEYKYQKVTSY